MTNLANQQYQGFATRPQEGAFNPFGGQPHQQQPFNPNTWSGNAPQQSAPQYSYNTVSPKLMRYAEDLYDRFNMDKTPLASMTYQQVKAEVDRLNKITPASDAQKQKIRELMDTLAKMGQPVIHDVYMIDQLTGGKEGTASKFIQQLQAEIEKNAHLVPITEGQINTLMSWYLCPDVPFENFGISRTVKLPEVSPKAWRYMYEDEFRHELATKISKQNASQFIDTFRGTVYTWRNSRISDGQFNRIRQLEQRMASLYVPKETTWALVDGEMQMVQRPINKDWNPNAYVPMMDQQLRQMSYDEASVFIDQLQSELEQPVRGTLEPSDASSRQQQLQDKHAGFNERTGVGVAHDQVMAQNKELNELIDLIFKLESICATEFWDLHELTNMDFVMGGGDKVKVIRTWRDAMEMAIDLGAITKSGLEQMCQNSQIASKIVELVEDLSELI